ncbi:hypothetical protein DFAR_2740002 [Desulfarculales bacterium]
MTGGQGRCPGVLPPAAETQLGTSGGLEEGPLLNTLEVFLNPGSAAAGQLAAELSKRPGVAQVVSS